MSLYFKRVFLRLVKKFGLFANEVGTFTCFFFFQFVEEECIIFARFGGSGVAPHYFIFRLTP